MEEDDLLKGWKKTQPKKTPIFKPADFPYFRIGVDNHCAVAPVLCKRAASVPQRYMIG